MNDYTKLKQSAEACQKYWDEEYPHRDNEERHYIDISESDDKPEMEFYKTANPATVLALIVENETLSLNLELQWVMADNAALEIDQLKAEVEALRRLKKDALRYRWIKKNSIELGQDGGMSSCYSLPSVKASSCGSLSAAIDAAMTDEQAK